MAATFILRRVDSKVWLRVKERAGREGRTLRGVVTMLVTRYADGRIDLNDGPPFRKAVPVAVNKTAADAAVKA